MTPEKWPIDRFINAYLVWIQEHTDEKKWESYRMQLEAPPPEATERVLPHEGESFMALMGALQGAEGVSLS